MTIQEREFWLDVHPERYIPDEGCDLGGPACLQCLLPDACRHDTRMYAFQQQIMARQTLILDDILSGKTVQETAVRFKVKPERIRILIRSNKAALSAAAQSDRHVRDQKRAAMFVRSDEAAAQLTRELPESISLPRQTIAKRFNISRLCAQECLLKIKQENRRRLSAWILKMDGDPLWTNGRIAARFRVTNRMVSLNRNKPKENND